MIIDTIKQQYQLMFALLTRALTMTPTKNQHFKLNMTLTGYSNFIANLSLNLVLVNVTLE